MVTRHATCPHARPAIVKRNLAFLGDGVMTQNDDNLGWDIIPILETKWETGRADNAQLSAQQRGLEFNRLAMLNAGMTTAVGIDALRNAYPNVTPIRQPKHRTQAEIIAQLEARYAEMEAEANSPAKLYPCKACRFSNGNRCENALVKGLGKQPALNADYWEYDHLCGPEKALWEPKPPTLWQRLKVWIASLFEGIN